MPLSRSVSLSLCIRIVYTHLYIYTIYIYTYIGQLGGRVWLYVDGSGDGSFCARLKQEVSVLTHGRLRGRNTLGSDAYANMCIQMYQCTYARMVWRAGLCVRPTRWPEEATPHQYI